MSKLALINLSESPCPLVIGATTITITNCRCTVITKIACTLYDLSDKESFSVPVLVPVTYIIESKNKSK